MLDAFIIEELRRRERLRKESERPVLEVPRPDEDELSERQRRKKSDEEAPKRGVVEIDLFPK